MCPVLIRKLQGEARKNMAAELPTGKEGEKKKELGCGDPTGKTRVKMLCLG